VGRGGRVGREQQNVYGFAASFACARRQGQPLAGTGYDGPASDRAGHAGPQAPRVPVPLSPLPLPSAVAAGSSSALQSPVL